MRDKKDKIILGKPEGKRQLGRSRRRWEDSIKTDLKEMRCENVDWIEEVQVRV
jgi:hypothetical protein